MIMMLFGCFDGVGFLKQVSFLINLEFVAVLIVRSFVAMKML